MVPLTLPLKSHDTSVDAVGVMLYLILILLTQGMQWCIDNADGTSCVT